MLIIDETKESRQYKDIAVGSIFEYGGTVYIKTSIAADAGDVIIQLPYMAKTQAMKEKISSSIKSSTVVDTDYDRYAICLKSGLPICLRPEQEVYMLEAELILKTYTGDDYLEKE